MILIFFSDFIHPVLLSVPSSKIGVGSQFMKLLNT